MHIMVPNIRWSASLLLFVFCVVIALVSSADENVPIEPAVAIEVEKQEVKEEVKQEVKEEENVDSALPIPLSISISGGVSLGGYQAGYLYYLTEIIKRNPGLLKTHLVTGTSAGTMNTMFSVVALGSETEDVP